MATPLINPLRVQGGTFYTFSSAVKDIQKTFSDDDARFVFSKFALLDIPDVATPSLNYENSRLVVVALASNQIGSQGRMQIPCIRLRSPQR